MTRLLVPAVLLVAAAANGAPPVQTLPGTRPLTWEERDMSPRMTGGIDRWLMRELGASVEKRLQHWRIDTSSPEAYEKSVEPNRQRFAQIIGVVDPRVSRVVMERFGDEANPALVAQTGKFKVHQVRWTVLEGVDAEGLLIEPAAPAVAHVVCIPDADQTPEMILGLAPGVAAESQFARRFAEAGCRVVIPTLLSRDSTFSGNARVKPTPQPHREWIYRQAFEMGRHVIGYEVQRTLAAVDYLQQTGGEGAKLAVAGYGEGGQIAFYAAALDRRIHAALVSGYFAPRERVWEEPLARNTWALLHEFGDAQIAWLVAPRTLIVEHTAHPAVQSNTTLTALGRPTQSPGKLWTPSWPDIEAEWNRAQNPFTKQWTLSAGDGADKLRPFIGDAGALLQKLGVTPAAGGGGDTLVDHRKAFDPAARQKRTVRQLENHVQNMILRTSMYDRDKWYWSRVDRSSADKLVKTSVAMREFFDREVMGKIDQPLMPMNPRTRKVYDTDKFTGYDVVLDVFDDVFAWGVLLVPKDIKPGEKRPVVVTQHGLEGLPAHTIERDSSKFRAYQGFSSDLAERGFVVFSPHNPYRGQEAFRTLVRKAQPLKLTLWSFIIPQHNQILNFLETLPYVDAHRIGFYGLSYGGKSAMRIPASETRYALSICSGDFNEWVWKNSTVDWGNSYMYTGEYEIYEWNLGHTFNYAEMGYLIFPRPFMVERGHKDGVALDEWCNFEYARIRRLYNQLGQGEKTEIEHFDGPHMIHGVGTYEFLHKHLNWPKRP